MTFDDAWAEIERRWLPDASEEAFGQPAISVVPIIPGAGHPRAQGSRKRMV